MHSSPFSTFLLHVLMNTYTNIMQLETLLWGPLFSIFAPFSFLSLSWFRTGKQITSEARIRRIQYLLHSHLFNILFLKIAKIFYFLKLLWGWILYVALTNYHCDSKMPFCFCFFTFMSFISWWIGFFSLWNT